MQLASQAQRAAVGAGVPRALCTTDYGNAQPSSPSRSVKGAQPRSSAPSDGRRWPLLLEAKGQRSIAAFSLQLAAYRGCWLPPLCYGA